MAIYEYSNILFADLDQITIDISDSSMNDKSLDYLTHYSKRYNEEGNSDDITENVLIVCFLNELSIEDKAILDNIITANSVVDV